MRELRPGAKRSVGREAHRKFYDDYIRSDAWRARREAFATWLAPQKPAGIIKCYGGCGTEWSLNRDDVHHIDYSDLGRERFDQLWPLCRVCHTALHQLLDLRSYRRLARPQANEMALAALRREQLS